MFQDAEKAKKHVLKKIEKIKRKNIKILEEGNTIIGWHNGKFLLWTRKFKSFLKRKEGEEFCAEFPTYCTGTERLVWIKVRCRTAENFILDRVKKLVSPAKFVCADCGLVAAKSENLCNPVSL
jgi:hypothetical protein